MRELRRLLIVLFTTVLTILTIIHISWRLPYLHGSIKSSYFDIVNLDRNMINVLSEENVMIAGDTVTLNTQVDAFDAVSNSIDQSSVSKDKRSSTIAGIPIILEWNNFYGLSLFNEQINLDKYCPLRCVVTTNKSMVEDAAVTIFHTGGGLVPNSRSSNSSFITIFLNFEPPPHRPLFKKIRTRFFDATITYRQDSTIPVYHDSFAPLDGPDDTDRWTDAEVDAAIRVKEKPALWMVSHCVTPSAREVYVAALREYMNITQIGYCNNEPCPKRQDCEKDLIKKHYFYMAFENSVCIDYITEKFFRIRQLIVPIVLDRRVFRGIHERLLNYTIIASDFDSPKQLAEYLQFLIDHPNEYRKYFEWTKVFKKSAKPFYDNETACKVCKIAHQAYNGTWKTKDLSIHKWWGEKMCYGHVGRELVQRSKMLKTD